MVGKSEKDGVEYINSASFGVVQTSASLNGNSELVPAFRIDC